MSRKRRGTLSGWWRYLPFVIVPFTLLFSEVWFQSQILSNEYRKNALRLNIRDAEAQLDVLHDEIRELARMERVLEHAPDLGLVPPAPGQVIEIEIAKYDAPPTRGVNPASVVPVLAAPPVRQAPLAMVKPVQTQEKSPVLLEELEPLEPENEWAE